MVTFIIVLFMFLVFGILCWLAKKTMDYHIDKNQNWKYWFIAAILYLATILTIVIELDKRENEVGPCIKEETGYAYNSATKSTMPYRYCAERGGMET
jgi:bacteriorhodopsin